MYIIPVNHIVYVFTDWPIGLVFANRFEANAKVEAEELDDEKNGKKKKEDEETKSSKCVIMWPY